MREVFIGIAVPPMAVEVLQNIQIRATAELRFREGFETHELSHGKSPFHMTLVSPFLSRTAAEDARIESGLERMSKEVRPFTVALDEASALGFDTVCLESRDQKHLRSLFMAAHNRIGRLAPPEFTAHVSLARKFPQGTLRQVLTACVRACEAYRDVFPLTFRAEGLALFVKEADGEWKVHTTYHLSGRKIAA